MTRRSFLRQAGTTAATGGVILGAPAIVSAQAQVRWRMASSFGKNLDNLYGAADIICRRVAALTGGRFQISLHAGGEIVPPLQVLDAVSNGTIECGHTAMYYYFGKDATWAFGTAVPFGLNARQMNSWWYEAGGGKVYNEFAAKAGVTTFLAGNTGTQMGGFFRKEIKTVADLKGLKFRIAGLAGQMLSKLGVVPQQLPPGDVYSSLEKGAIDAAEFTVPYDDEKLGLGKVARFYYTPGFWEGGAALHGLVNNKAWEALPQDFKAAFESATYEANAHMTAKYDNQNPSALRRMLASGVQLRAFPKPVMDAAYKSIQEVYAELNGKNPEFKKVYDSYFGFQREQLSWYGVGESRFDQYMQGTRG